MYEITLNFTYTLKIDWLKIIEGLYFAFLSKVLLKKNAIWYVSRYENDIFAQDSPTIKERN